MMNKGKSMLYCLLAVIFLLLLSGSSCYAAVEFYVSPNGPGTREHLFASLDRARQVIANRDDRSEPVTVFLDGGTYYLPDTLVFQASDSGIKAAPITYASLNGQNPVINGSQKLELTLSPCKNGIKQAIVPPGTTADQLFVIGQGEISAYGLHGGIGVLIMQILVSSITNDVGLKEGDEILKCQDKEINGMDDLFSVFGDTTMGTKVTLDIWRLQQQKSIEVVIE